MTPPRWVTRHGATVVAMAAGGATVVVGSLLPWVRTGQRHRHSYDVFALIERLGFAPGGPAALALRWWPLVPLATAVAVVVAWWGWRRAGGALGALAGAYAGAIGLVVATAPPRRVVDVEAGAVVTALGGAVLLVASVMTFLISHPGRTAPTEPAPSARPAGPPAGR